MTAGKRSLALIERRYSCSCRRRRRQNRAEDLPLRTAAATTLQLLPEYLPSSRRSKRALGQFSALPQTEFCRREIFYRARRWRLFFLGPPQPVVASATQTVSAVKQHHPAPATKTRPVSSKSRRPPL